jgi:hypothetical protein
MGWSTCERTVLISPFNPAPKFRRNLSPTAHNKRLNTAFRASSFFDRFRTAMQHVSFAAVKILDGRNTIFALLSGRTGRDRKSI